MKVARRKQPKQLISMTPLIDVMLILLVFFMVTSTYLDLDMMPMVQSSVQPASGDTRSGDEDIPVLVRLDAKGTAHLRGRPMPTDQMEDIFRSVLQDTPTVRILLLPSGAASTQALVSLIDAATQAGIVNIKVIRPEAVP